MGSGLSVYNVEGVSLPDSTTTDAILDAFSDFHAATGGFLPNTVTVKVHNEIELHLHTTGALTGTTSGTGQPTTTGSFTSGYWAGVGCRVRWPTGAFRNGRPITGTTFIVPLGGNVVATDGTLGGSIVADLTTAGTALLTALEAAGHPLGVWSRPSSAGGSDGIWTPASGCVVPDQVSWLTTRRS